MVVISKNLLIADVFQITPKINFYYSSYRTNSKFQMTNSNVVDIGKNILLKQGTCDTIPNSEFLAEKEQNFKGFLFQ
jgi:hypothetical protein